MLCVVTIALLAKEWGSLEELHELTESGAENSVRQVCIVTPCPQAFLRGTGWNLKVDKIYTLPSRATSK